MLGDWHSADMTRAVRGSLFSFLINITRAQSQTQRNATMTARASWTCVNVRLTEHLNQAPSPSLFFISHSLAAKVKSSATFNYGIAVIMHWMAAKLCHVFKHLFKNLQLNKLDSNLLKKAFWKRKHTTCVVDKMVHGNPG